MGRLPTMPHHHQNTQVHTQIPGLASAQCWDYRIRTLFHYLPTLYSIHTHTYIHTYTHTGIVLVKDRPKTDNSVNHNCWCLHIKPYSYSVSLTAAGKYHDYIVPNFVVSHEKIPANVQTTKIGSILQRQHVHQKVWNKMLGFFFGMIKCTFLKVRRAQAYNLQIEFFNVSSQLHENVYIFFHFSS